MPRFHHCATSRSQSSGETPLQTALSQLLPSTIITDYGDKGSKLKKGDRVQLTSGEIVEVHEVFQPEPVYLGYNRLTVLSLSHPLSHPLYCSRWQRGDLRYEEQPFRVKYCTERTSGCTSYGVCFAHICSTYAIPHVTPLVVQSSEVKQWPDANPDHRDIVMMLLEVARWWLQ